MAIKRYILSGVAVVLCIGLLWIASRSSAPAPQVVGSVKVEDVDFSIECYGSNFSDTLHLKGQVVTDARIEALEKARCEKWHAFIEEQSRIVRTPEELQ